MKYKRPNMYRTFIKFIFLIWSTSNLSCVHAKRPNRICGTQSPLHEGQPFRISHPWDVEIFYIIDKIPDVFGCKGVLLSKEYVLTTASCVDNRKASRLTLHIGDRFGKQEQSGVSKIIKHEDYYLRENLNNIALLKLVSPITFNDYVKPICLWSNQDDISEYYKQEGVTTKEVNLTITNDCIDSSISQYFEFFKNEKTFCAKSSEDKDFCRGYEGAGLILKKNKWKLRAIASFPVYPTRSRGDDLQPFKVDLEKCVPNKYVLFVDIAKHLDWIKEKMA